MAKVWLQAPPAHLFKFPPSSAPEVLPAPQLPVSLAQPFRIDPKLYNDALDVRVPLTIATIYAVTVAILNAVNRQQGHKPWAISKTRIFFALVIAHNVFLAVYSAWTHIGMINAIRNIWPGWYGMKSLPNVVDVFCKMQGPRGIGDGISYNPTDSKWTVSNPSIKLLDNRPDHSDIGRLWNQGLAYYGWLFYLSKFYEVIDTLVILAKGKRSSFLQTYHHAGAMLCMWAGIRYMSPPIMLFCLVNSGIHALMYTYYTLSALGIKVPGILKRTLTSMQITQFVIGFAFAIMHLFVAYDIPVQSPYMFYHNLSTALPSATAIVARAAATADVGSWLKKAILRAAGDEGLSSNVRNKNGYLFGHSGEQAVLAESDLLKHSKEEIRYRLEYVATDCIDTSGQAFAIYLNLLYLLPLTMLFLRFFFKSYLRRPVSGQGESQARRWSKSGYDAARGVEKEVVKAMRRDRGSAFTSPADSDAEANSSNGSSSRNKNKLSMTKIKAQASETAEDFVSKGVNGVKNLSKKAKESDLAANARNAVDKIVGSGNEASKTLQNKAGNVANKTADSIKKTTNDVQKTAHNAADSAKGEKTKLQTKAENTANQAAATAKKATKDLKDKTENTAKDVESELKQASEDNIVDGKEESEGTAGEAVKSPSKKKRKHKPKNKEHNHPQQDSQHDSEHPESYAEAAAKPPTAKANDVIPVHGEKIVVDDEGEKESTEAPDLMAQSYETSIDEITTDEQKEAEKEMQPEGLSKS